MEKEFIPYEQASKLKELGYNEPCLAYYTFTTERLSMPLQTPVGCVNINTVTLDNIYKDYCLAPIYQQAFDWFGEKHGLYSWIIPCKVWDDNKKNVAVRFDVYVDEKLADFCETLQEAKLSALKKLILLVEKAPECMKECGNTYPSGGLDDICLNCGSSIK